MNISDTKIFGEGLFNEMELARDEDFQKKIWKNFLEKHPGFDPQDPKSDAFEEGSMIGSSLCFRMENEQPENVEEAIMLIKCKLFFAPTLIWLNDQEYLINKSQVKSRRSYKNFQNQH
jgi:hypothetical protein